MWSSNHVGGILKYWYEWSRAVGFRWLQRIQWLRPEKTNEKRCRTNPCCRNNNYERPFSIGLNSRCVVGCLVEGDENQTGPARRLECDLAAVRHPTIPPASCLRGRQCQCFPARPKINRNDPLLWVATRVPVPPVPIWHRQYFVGPTIELAVPLPFPRRCRRCRRRCPRLPLLLWLSTKICWSL